MPEIKISNKNAWRLESYRHDKWNDDAVIYHLTEFAFMELEKWQSYVRWATMHLHNSNYEAHYSQEMDYSPADLEPSAS